MLWIPAATPIDVNTRLPSEGPRFRYTLRMLAIVVLLIAIASGWLANVWHRVVRQRATVAQIEALEGRVVYDRPQAEQGPPIIRALISDDAFHYVKHVYLNSKPVTDADLPLLAGLPRLNAVSLLGAKITDAGMDHLAASSKLRVLTLIDTNVTTAGLAHLQAAERLASLALSGPQVTDDALLKVASLSHLDNLVLSFTDVGDGGLAHVARLKNLKSLALAFTNVTDGGIDHILQLKELKHLYLLSTDVTDAGLARLTALEHLENLVVGPHVTAAGIRALRVAMPNCLISARDIDGKRL